MADTKYTLFRNYMANELGITKGDIKNWTTEAVTDRVDKLVGQLNVDELIKKVIRSELSYTRINELAKEAIKEEVAQAFVKKYKVEVSERK